MTSPDHAVGVRLARTRDGGIVPGVYSSITDEGVSRGIGVQLTGLDENDAVVVQMYLLTTEDITADLIGQLLITAAQAGMATVVDRVRKQLAYADEHWPSA